MYDMKKVRPVLSAIGQEAVDKLYEVSYGVGILGGTLSFAIGKEELYPLAAGGMLYGLSGIFLVDPIRYKLRKMKESSK